MHFLLCLKPGLQVYICYMPMFMWVRAHVHVSVCMCVTVEVRGQCPVSSSITLPFICWDRNLRSPRSTLIWLDWLANKLQESFHFYLQSPGVAGFLPHLASVRLLGIKLRSSFWCSTHWGSSSAPCINSPYISFKLLNLNMFYNK